MIRARAYTGHFVSRIVPAHIIVQLVQERLISHFSDIDKHVFSSYNYTALVITIAVSVFTTTMPSLREQRIRSK